MRAIKIRLVTLGNLKWPVDFSVLEGWRSRVFSVEHADQVQVLPDPDINGWTYSDELLQKLLNHNQNYDITVGIANVPLERNYYTRRFHENTSVISLFEIADILRVSNLRIEQFLLRTFYQLCCYYLEAGGRLPDSGQSSAHGETRGCLFDMNVNKADIVFSTAQPCICNPCRTRIMGSQVPRDFLSLLDKELRRIRKDLYYRIADFVKSHPVLSLLITAVTGLLLNIFASYLYDLLTELAGRP